MPSLPHPRPTSVSLVHELDDIADATVARHIDEDDRELLTCAGG